MPSPFPGMDPYLENPALWRGVHHLLIADIDISLNALVRPRYVARIEERVYVAQTDRDVWPDVLVRDSPRTGKRSPRRTARARGGEGNGESDPPLLLTVEPVEVREAFVVIREVQGAGRIVTVIEVLSPSNKTRGTPGRRQYQEKQKEILHSRTHLLEIDLLRYGEYTAAAP